MKFEQIKDESPEGFRRLTGVKRTTFTVMIKILNEAQFQLKAKGGKPNKLSIEDRLLMALEYLREYRTYFHISRSYGLSESTCYRNIRWVEDTLIKDGQFSLPGRKALLKSDVNYEVVLIDATETPIERPKKTKNLLFWQKKRHTLKTQIIVDRKKKEIICTNFCNGKRSNEWFERHLCTSLKPKTTVVMDNASFHKSPKLVGIAKKFDVQILYLPAYSPDLNPIEKVWANFKRMLRKINNNFENLADAISYVFNKIFSD